MMPRKFTVEEDGGGSSPRTTPGAPLRMMPNRTTATLERVLSTGAWSTRSACRSANLQLATLVKGFDGVRSQNDEMRYQDGGTKGSSCTQLARQRHRIPWAAVQQRFAGRNSL